MVFNVTTERLSMSPHIAYCTHLLNKLYRVHSSFTLFSVSPPCLAIFFCQRAVFTSWNSLKSLLGRMACMCLLGRCLFGADCFYLWVHYITIFRCRKIVIFCCCFLCTPCLWLYYITFQERRKIHIFLIYGGTKNREKALWIAHCLWVVVFDTHLKINNIISVFGIYFFSFLTKT